MSGTSDRAKPAPRDDILAGPRRADLEDWLRRRLSAQGGLDVERVAGGQSNPTYFVTLGAQRMVLRRPPGGEGLESAHAVDREFRVMAALAGSGVPVPRMIALETDASVVGTPFYLMERLEGRVVHDSRLGALAGPRGRAAVYADVAATLARLHGVDWAECGLSDFGRPGGYFQRQIRRWTRQWELSRFRAIPEIDQLAAWLPANVPEADETAIVHGDYRIGNLLLHPADPRIVGVLDWELSTLGHPLADLAHASMFWLIRPEEYGGLLGCALAASGIPARAEFEECYLRAAGRSDGLTRFHIAFALFRFAVIFEGIAARARTGIAAGANAAELGDLSITFARRAAAILAHDGPFEKIAREST